MIFIAIESLKLSYSDIMIMPFSLLVWLIEQKVQLNEEIGKQLENNKEKELKVSPFYWS